MVKIVDNYSLGRLLGKGEYGKVYHGVNLQTKIQVAIKMIDLNKFIQNPKLVELTKNQLETINILQDNINVIKFVEMIKTEKNIYLIYEFCQGGTLQEFIATKRQEKQAKSRTNQQFLHRPSLHRANSLGSNRNSSNSLIMPEREVLIIFKQLINAFKSLNQHNIIHRDIKPNNIFFKSGHLKLADFGFCKILKSSDDLTQTSLGSPMYMAPQVLNGDIYGSKADIWSVGIVLYQMLFGVCPISDCSIKDLLKIYNDGSNIEEMIPIATHTLTPTCQIMLMRMLQKDQFRRISWQDFFYQYQITENGVIIRRQKDFEYDLMRLMKKTTSHSSVHSQKAILSNFKYDWSKLTNMKSSIHSEQFQSTQPQQNFKDTHKNPQRLDIDQIYRIRKKIKYFDQEHQKMLYLGQIFQQIVQSPQQYKYSEQICYIIAYNIESILTQNLKDVEKYQQQNRKILDNDSSMCQTLERIYVVFRNEHSSVVEKLKQIRILILSNAGSSNAMPEVIKYSSDNLSLAKKIGRKYSQQYQKNVPEIMNLNQNSNQKQKIQNHQIFVLKVLWGALSLTEKAKTLEPNIMAIQKQRKPKEIYKLFNQILVSLNSKQEK